ASRLGGATPVGTAGRAAAAETPAAAALRFGPGLIDVERATIQIGAVQSRDRPVGLGRVRHFDESKAAGTASVPVGHQTHTLHTPVRLKKRTEGGFRGREIQITYKNIFHGFFVSQLFLPDEADVGFRPGSRGTFKRRFQYSRVRLRRARSGGFECATRKPEIHGSIGQLRVRQSRERKRAVAAAPPKLPLSYVRGSESASSRLRRGGGKRKITGTFDRARGSEGCGRSCRCDCCGGTGCSPAGGTRVPGSCAPPRASCRPPFRHPRRRSRRS